MQALAGRDELVRRISRITAQDLAEELDAADPPVVLDVRTDAERQAMSIPGSLHIPLQRLPSRLSDVAQGRRPVVVHCASGYRSSIAASLLERHGRASVVDLVGGIAAWKASHLGGGCTALPRCSRRWPSLWFQEARARAARSRRGLPPVACR